MSRSIIEIRTGHQYGPATISYPIVGDIVHEDTDGKLWWRYGSH